MERLREEEHEAGCCCQFNPTSDVIEQNVLASECCPIHNYNPLECLCSPPCTMLAKPTQVMTDKEKADIYDRIVNIIAASREEDDDSEYDEFDPATVLEKIENIL